MKINFFLIVTSDSPLCNVCSQLFCQNPDLGLRLQVDFTFAYLEVWNKQEYLLTYINWCFTLKTVFRKKKIKRKKRKKKKIEEEKNDKRLNKLGLSCAKLSLASAKLHTSLSSDQLKLATN